MDQQAAVFSSLQVRHGSLTENTDVNADQEPDDREDGRTVRRRCRTDGVLMGVTTIANSLGRPGYALTMPGTENTVPDVRAVVRAIAHVWEMSDLADDAVLVVSELVTNAVKHTDTILLRVTVNRPEPHVIRIEVSDRSPQPPTPRCPGDTEEGGRGLALVEALTSRWGTEPTRKGKRVWGELRSTT